MVKLPLHLHFWTHCCVVKPNCSTFKTITVIILGVPTFRVFTVPLKLLRLAAVPQVQRLVYRFFDVPQYDCDQRRHDNICRKSVNFFLSIAICHGWT